MNQDSELRHRLLKEFDKSGLAEKVPNIIWDEFLDACEEVSEELKGGDSRLKVAENPGKSNPS